MDYDDNDFQSQNFHLGEDSNISPSVRSFTLPKYDFDENLQVHLGFSGLDDTEDLLGIQSQQHSHWIEDFSRGSSRIEFDSGATESCCISRHNNVWSEAASSESVEMLLKSVGQDEGIVKEIVTEELVCCDGFNTLNVQMDCNNNKNKGLSKGPALPPDKSVTQLLSSGADSENQPSPLTLKEEDAGSINIIAAESFAGKKCISVQNLTPIGSLDGDVIEDSTDGDRQLVADGVAGCSAGEVAVLETKMISVEGDGEKEKVEIVKTKSIPCLVDGGLCANSTKENELMEFEMEPLSLKGEKNIEIGPTNKEREDHTSEKPLLQGVEQKGEGEVSSSGRAEVQAEDSHKSSISSSVVKVYSPADLIRVPGETKMTIEDYGNSETGADEMSCRDPLHLTVSDKVAESDISIPNVVTNVSENVIQAQQCCIDHQGHEKKSAHSDDTESGTSSKETNVVTMAETLTDEQNTSTMSEEMQGFLHEIEVGGQTSSAVVLEDATETMALKKLEVNNLPSRKSQVMDPGVEGKKPGVPCSSEVETVFFGKEKEPASDICSESSSLPAFKADSSISEAGNTVDILSETVPQHVALAVDSINGNCKDELQASIALENRDKELTNASVVHACDQEEKDGLDALPLKFEVKETGNGEETGNADVVESPHALGLDTQKVNEHILNSEIHVESHKQGDKDANHVHIVVENVMESTAAEAGGASDSGEQKCGSPIVISSQEQLLSKKDSQDCSKMPQEQNGSLLGDTNLVMDATDKPFDNVDSTTNDALEDEKSFTFEVGSLEDLSDKEISQGLKPSSGAQHFGSSKGCEECPKELSICQSDDEVVQEAVLRNNQVSSELKVDSGLAKNTSDDKVMLASSSGTPKRTSMKGRAPKETSSRKRKQENIVNVSSPSSSSAGNALQSVSVAGIKQYSCTEGNDAKPSSASTYQASNLPDLNYADSPALLHQPFTDLQQVQLRAQIFVYGSLIQGTAPDEACMVSAFGDRSQDGGRNMWETTWRLAVEKFYSQKSPMGNLESPLYALSGDRSAQDKPSSSETFPSVIAPVQLSSPLWSAVSQPQDVMQCSNTPRSSLTDSYQSLSPYFPYQFSQMQYRGNAALWPSQASIAGSPGMVPPQRTTLDAGQQYSALSIAEAVQATPGRELSTTSIVQFTPSSPLASTAGPANLPASPATAKDGKRKSPLSSAKVVSVDQKSRKRRKNSSPENLVQITPVNQTQKESTSNADSLTRCVASTADIPSTFTPASSKVVSCNFLAASSISSAHFQIVPAGIDARQKAIFVEETHSKIEQAKLQAEDAASHASSAAKHCQDIWGQLSIQKNFDLVSDVEAKLASAAVAAAAGASVAMAAALAAKVASDAVLQTKLMIDEALKHGSTDSASSLMGCMAPSPNLKGKNKGTNFNSIIAATSEAAHKRVEATSAAAKRAENLNAIVKAAELALEAVAQAGTIVAMGDPLPLKLNELLESGLEGHWKLHLVPDEHKMATNKDFRNGEDSNMIDAQEAADGGNQHVPGEMPSGKLVNGRHLNSFVEKGLGAPEGQKQANPGEIIGNITGSDIGSQSSFFIPAQNVDSNRIEHVVATEGCSIAEGILVEVVPNEDGFKGVWHSAKVLVVENERAYVCYNELLQDEGSDHLKEWVPLKGEGDEPPRIRIAHPVTTAMKYEGTRKRQRAAIRNYTWSIGDQVDVCVRSSWRTAIVIQKDKGDDTKLTVQFRGEKDLSVVRAWDVRPALLWKDGRWVEWCRQDHYHNNEGDTPLIKRQKLGGEEVGIEPLAEGEMNFPKEQVVKNIGKFEGSWAPMLSEKDKIFTMGKSTGEQPNSDALKMKRTGLQKEGSKVIFGIPKPGKTRKFMEVSKHYVADKPPKNNEVTDSTKLAKYLMPQGSSRSWKNTPKVDFRGKQLSDPEPKMLRSGKAQTMQRKPLSETELSSGLARHVSTRKGKRSVSHKENGNGNQNSLEIGSSSDGFRTSEDAGSVFSSDALSSKKFTTVEAGKGAKGKLGIGGKVPGGQEKGSRLNDHPANPSSDSVEPRRSNRRIQPTCRLLEGLQSSSLNVTKLPPPVPKKKKVAPRVT